MPPWPGFGAAPSAAADGGGWGRGWPGPEVDTGAGAEAGPGAGALLAGLAATAFFALPPPFLAGAWACAPVPLLPPSSTPTSTSGDWCGKAAAAARQSRPLAACFALLRPLPLLPRPLACSPPLPARSGGASAALLLLGLPLPPAPAPFGSCPRLLLRALPEPMAA